MAAMSPRLWLVLVFALAGAFAPSRADARGAETCAQGFLATATTARPESEPQVAGSQQGFAACGYELASGYPQAAETSAAEESTVADEIANGHAYDKHVTTEGQYGDISPSEFAD